MKHSIFAFFILFSLLWFASLSYARKEPKDYWEGIMKDKPMPKALADLFYEDDADGNSIKMDHFVKDFDLKSSAIIYHRRSEPTKEKQEGKSIKPEKLKVPTYTQELKD